MYLARLSEKQKDLFLDVCINLSKTDNDFAKEEKEVIGQLCDEMNLEPRYETNKNSNNLINELAKISNQNEKRMIVIELIGIVIADKKIADNERDFMNGLLKAFEMDPGELDEAIVLVNKLYDVYGKFADFINR